MELFCRMCGELIQPDDESGVCDCEHCGSRQTFPLNYRGIKLDTYNKACRLRIKTDFEGAEKLLKQLCAEVPDESEGFWELVLCRNGIVYEADDSTSLRKPVCQRTSFIPVKRDENFVRAAELANEERAAVYQREAAAVEMLRSENVQQKGDGKRYDILICSADNEKDSNAAAEICEQLNAEGYSVYLSAQPTDTEDISVREYIFNAALNSAQALIIVCRNPESFAAAPLKGEWSRCVSAVHKDGGKQLLTCISDMDSGDVPDELSAYHIMEMGGIGFMAELIRFIRKNSSEGNSVSSKTAPETLIRRMKIFLADEDFEAAEEYCDLILDASPRCWQAHWARFLIYNGCRSSGDLLLEEVVESFARDYIEQFGFDFSEDDAFERQLASILGDMPAKAIEYADGEDKLKLTTNYERFVNAVRDAVFAREQENIDDEEKLELDAIRRRHDKEEQKKAADEKKRQDIRTRYLTYAAVIFTVLIIVFVKFKSVWAAVLIIIMIIVTVLVMGGLSKRD